MALSHELSIDIFAIDPECCDKSAVPIRVDDPNFGPAILSPNLQSRFRLNPRLIKLRRVVWLAELWVLCQHEVCQPEFSFMGADIAVSRFRHLDRDSLPAQ